MTTVTVDTNKCRDYGICVAIHPEVFAIPPGSPVAVVLKERLDADDLEDVNEAVRSCPAQALTLVEG